MRLFAGLSLPADLVARVEETIEQLRPVAPNLRWSLPGNLHITTKFIGEWPDAKVDVLHASLKKVQVPAFDVHLAGFGWFPNPHSPRSFWVAARGGEPLVQLAAKTDDVAAGLGVAAETHVYTPHVTLARVDAGIDLRNLRGTVAEIKKPEWGSLRAEEFVLYRSDSGPAGSVYTKLARFPFGPLG